MGGARRRGRRVLPAAGARDLVCCRLAGGHRHGGHRHCRRRRAVPRVPAFGAAGTGGDHADAVHVGDAVGPAPLVLCGALLRLHHRHASVAGVDLHLPRRRLRRRARVRDERGGRGRRACSPQSRSRSSVAVSDCRSLASCRMRWCSAASRATVVVIGWLLLSIVLFQLLSMRVTALWLLADRGRAHRHRRELLHAHHRLRGGYVRTAEDGGHHRIRQHGGAARRGDGARRERLPGCLHGQWRHRRARRVPGRVDVGRADGDARDGDRRGTLPGAEEPGGDHAGHAPLSSETDRTRVSSSQISSAPFRQSATRRDCP